MLPLEYTLYHGRQKRDLTHKNARVYDLEYHLRAWSGLESENGGRGQDRRENAWKRLSRTFRPFPIVFLKFWVRGSDPRPGFGKLHKSFRNLKKRVFLLLLTCHMNETDLFYLLYQIFINYNWLITTWKPFQYTTKQYFVKPSQYIFLVTILCHLKLFFH